MKKLESNLFHSLWRDRNSHHYIVTNDGYFYTDFYAEDDAEALAIFRNGDYK